MSYELSPRCHAFTYVMRMIENREILCVNLLEIVKYVNHLDSIRAQIDASIV